MLLVDCVLHADDRFDWTGFYRNVGDDVLKIREAEDALTEVLGWTGLGTCEGETITDTAIELTCRVLDPDLATTRIAEQMAGTEFADYSRIYQE